MIKSIVIAVVFSLVYVNLYTILRGDAIIYHSPPWSAGLATAYVAGGVLLQAWFCFRRATQTAAHPLAAQIVTGLLYAAAILAFPGGIFQS